jgi:hypothetical protein
VSYSLSTTGKASIFAASTAEVWLHLLIIDHDDLTAPIRLVDNTEAVVSRGDTYLPFAFRPQIPAEVDGQLPKVELQIDAVDQTIIAALEVLQTPPTITLEVVMAGTPDTVERGPWYFTIRSLNYNALTIRSELTYEALTAEPFPYRRFTPTEFPGLFNAVDR